MKKLELKHITPYLPYDLKVTFDGDEHTHLLVGLENSIDGAKLISEFGDFGTAKYQDARPILRPLSDLTKPCLPDGKIPILELAKITNTWISEHEYDRIVIGESSDGDGVYLAFFRTASPDDDLLICIEEYDMYSQRWKVIQKLIEWHFDVYGLIEERLAIDINTLNK